MAAVTICSGFGAQENKICHCFYFFPFCLPWSDRIRCHNLSFFERRVLSRLFHSLTLIKRLVSSSSFSATRLISSAYLRLFFSPSNLYSSCDSFSPAFCMMYSAYELKIRHSPTKHSTTMHIWKSALIQWYHAICRFQTLLQVQQYFFFFFPFFVKDQSQDHVVHFYVSIFFNLVHFHGLHYLSWPILFFFF